MRPGSIAAVAATVMVAASANAASAQREPPPPPKENPSACKYIKCLPHQEWIAAAGYQPARELRRALGRPPADRDGSRRGFVAHHIIPVELFKGFGGYLQDWGAICKLDPNSRYNGVYLRGSSRRYGERGYARLSPAGRSRMYFKSARGATYRTSIGKRIARLGGDPEDGTCGPALRARFFHALATVKRDLINGRLRVD